jgi:hypothetical protein
MTELENKELNVNVPTSENIEVGHEEVSETSLEENVQVEVVAESLTENLVEESLNIETELHPEVVEAETSEVVEQHTNATDTSAMAENQNETPEVPVLTIETQVQHNDESKSIDEQLVNNSVETKDASVNQSETLNTPAESAIVEMHNEDEDSENDAEENGIDDSETDDIDYSTLTKEELMALAAASLSKIPKEAVKRLQNIRPYLDEIFKLDRKAALDTFIEEGGEAENFEFSEDLLRDQFYVLFKQAQEARAEERKRIEDEKLKNYARKKEILNLLMELTEKDETLQSIEEVKKLQAEWKIIRAVPKENVQELWDSYHYYLNKFYDNHSINLELKELDRKKNLDFKIDLCKKIEELHEEKSIKKTFILLNKYHDEFKNTGPVPREFSEEIWARFKGASDAVYNEKRAVLEEIEGKQTINLQLKQVLVEKASIIAASSYNNIKDWNVKTDELNAIFEEWKAIGPVPKSNNEVIWKAFREHFNEFYKNKSEYFQQKNKERKTNLALKEALCKRAEELMNGEDFGNTTKEILKLQNDWKAIGAVPDKVSNAIWKRFRTACDTFFSRKQANYQDKKEVEEANLAERQVLIEKVNALLEADSKATALAGLKEINKSWLSSGFVPFKVKNEINSTYDKAVEAVYKKFELSKESMRTGQAKEHYNSIMALPNGSSRVKQEELKVREKIRFLKGEIETWENNIEFFARSKNADKLKQEIQSKIDKSNSQIARLMQELNTIKALEKEKAV